ncbi:OmpA family protein [uncultured Polaribacter sp.]|uniref:OmpA family protein n=1 Tax=uncultured Polaribacter sp. TaxID=174711 RepID=UPI0026190E2B|nr:OmpA family protein [uncultured Polaribacter sp.]
MKTKLTYILLLFVCLQTYSQRKYIADRYYKEYAYKKSAELYEKIYDKGDHSKLVLERLGDSYYNNTNTQEAEKWYKELFKKYKLEVSSEYFFRYAQVLKSNEKYRESDALMQEYAKENPLVVIGSQLETTPNYSSEYSDDPTKKNINLYNVALNTEYSDYGGFLQGDNFYFASTKPTSSKSNKIYKWNNQPFYNLYTSKVTDTGLEDSKEIELTNQKLLSSNINTRYHDASAVITKDGKTMYFTRDNFDGKRKGKDRNRETHLKIYKAVLVDGIWGNVTELPFNNDEYSVGHPALSVDENTLYFVSDMPGGIGSTDIYRVSILSESRYGKPVNLGETINTVGREMFPFVSNNNELYFSSDGHLGLGGLDIFKSKITGAVFSNAENIEAPFNSSLDDFSFTINTDETKGFLSSNRKGGKGDDDIYSFVIPCTQNITGIIRDSQTGEIISQATVKLMDNNGVILKTVKSNTEGVYVFSAVDCTSNFKLLAEKLNYTSDRGMVNTTSILGETQELDLVLTPLIIRNEIVINPIFFDFDKFNIRDEAAYELEKIISVLNDNPDMIIKIESHTDSRATKSYNKKLSSKRAKSSRDYIISRGIAAHRIISAIGYGESQLLNDCTDENANKCSEEEHQRNRRSKFVIVSGNNKDNVKVNDPSSVILKKIDSKLKKN